jgi:tetraacyldisaccharide 4'-kinase
MSSEKHRSLLKLEPPSWWYEGPIPLAAWGLLPISMAYGAIVERRFRNTAPYRSKLPVICIGNFTLGGAGKTPLALKVASMLASKGLRPAFLSRGYGGRERGPHLAGFAKDDAARVGDEPLLLAQAAPTVISRDRPAGAKLLEEARAGAVIMDDGFQNPSLMKNFSLVAVDAGTGIGSGRVFPLGPLRAALAFQAPMASAIVLMGRQNSAAMASFKAKLTAFAPATPIFEAAIVPAVTNEMRAKAVIAFCGIGRPAKFFETLAEAEVPVVRTRSFPDHHFYSEAEARVLLTEASSKQASLITTSKDHVRLKGKAGALGELYRSALALPITVVFKGGDEERLLDAIVRSL